MVVFLTFFLTGCVAGVYDLGQHQLLDGSTLEYVGAKTKGPSGQDVTRLETWRYDPRASKSELVVADSASGPGLTETILGTIGQAAVYGGSAVGAAAVLRPARTRTNITQSGGGAVAGGSSAISGGSNAVSEGSSAISGGSSAVSGGSSAVSSAEGGAGGNPIAVGLGGAGGTGVGVGTGGSSSSGAFAGASSSSSSNSTAIQSQYQSQSSVNNNTNFNANNQVVVPPNPPSPPPHPVHPPKPPHVKKPHPEHPDVPQGPPTHVPGQGNPGGPQH